MKEKQKQALEEFYKSGYVNISAPRRSGKTHLLKHIIKNNKDKKILVIVPSIHFYFLYEDEKVRVSSIENINIKSSEYDIILGDEVVLPKINGVMVACVYTQNFKVVMWELDMDTEEFKKSMPYDAYYAEFGQYNK